METKQSRKRTAAGERTASERVLDAVADREGTDPAAFDRPLYEVVDPDALDALFRDGGEAVVKFTYRGYAVTVEGGRVTVRDE